MALFQIMVLVMKRSHAVQVKPLLDTDSPSLYYKEALWL